MSIQWNPQIGDADIGKVDLTQIYPWSARFSFRNRSQMNARLSICDWKMIDLFYTYLADWENDNGNGKGNIYH